jgi:hypothetical protein
MDSIWYYVFFFVIGYFCGKKQEKYESAIRAGQKEETYR